MPDMDALTAWLKDREPPADEVSIVHGDFRVDNLVFHPSEPRVLAVLDVLQTKLVKRGVSLKSVDFGEDSEPKPSGKEYRLEGVLKEGLSQENAKRVTKLIRDEFGKTVKTVIQGDEVRVSSKSRDDLQAVQRALKASSDIDAALQFTNYR